MQQMLKLHRFHLHTYSNYVINAFYPWFPFQRDTGGLIRSRIQPSPVEWSILMPQVLVASIWLQSAPEMGSPLGWLVRSRTVSGWRGTWMSFHRCQVAEVGCPQLPYIQ